MYYTHYRKNSLAIDQRMLTIEQKNIIFNQLTSAYVYEEGPILYLCDLNNKKEFNKNKVQIVIVRELHSISCALCACRLEEVTHGKCCDRFEPYKKEAKIAIGKLINTLESFNYLKLSPMEFHKIIYPKKHHTYQIMETVIDLRKCEDRVQIKEDVLLFPYWRFGTTGKLIESVMIEIPFKRNLDLPYFLYVNLYNSAIDFYSAADYKTQDMMLKRIRMKMNDWIVDEMGWEEADAVYFHNYTSSKRFGVRCVNLMKKPLLVASIEGRDYYKCSAFVYLKIGYTLYGFLEMVKKPNITHYNEHELFHDRVNVYEKLGTIDEIEFNDLGFRKIK
jgi:hypothetical protein